MKASAGKANPQTVNALLKAEAGDVSLNARRCFA